MSFYTDLCELVAEESIGMVFIHCESNAPFWICTNDVSSRVREKINENKTLGFFF